MDQRQNDELLDGHGRHAEFVSEAPMVVETPESDLDGYVDRSGHMKPHQTPLDVAHEMDAQAELDASLHEIPMRDES